MDIIDRLKLIYSNVPIWLRWIVIVGCCSTLIRYVFIQYSTGNEIEFNSKNLKIVLIIIVLLTGVGYIVGSLRALTASKIGYTEKTGKKRLPYSSISIGSICRSSFSFDVRARILLNENITPSIDIFLDRIHAGQSHCTKCKCGAQRKYSYYRGNSTLIGYECKRCGIEVSIDFSEHLNEIRGFVRKNFKEMWKRYSASVQELTKHRPEDYTLPESD